MKGVRQRWSYPESKKVLQHLDQDEADAIAKGRCRETSKSTQRNSIAIINTEKVPNPKTDNFPEAIVNDSKETESSVTNVQEEDPDFKLTGSEQNIEPNTDQSGLSRYAEDCVFDEEKSHIDDGNCVVQNSDGLDEIRKGWLQQNSGLLKDDPSSVISKTDDSTFQTDEPQNDDGMVSTDRRDSDPRRDDGIKSLIGTDSTTKHVLADYVNISQEERKLDGAIDQKVSDNDKDTAIQSEIQIHEDFIPSADSNSVDIIKDSDSISLTEDESSFGPGTEIANVFTTNDSKTMKSSITVPNSSGCIALSTQLEEKSPVESVIEGNHIDVVGKETFDHESKLILDDQKPSASSVDDGRDNEGYEIEYDNRGDCSSNTEEGNNLPLEGWEDELAHELQLNEVNHDVDEMTDTADVKKTLTDTTTLTSKEGHGHKREVVILDLNSLLLDVDKVRLSHLSDISEENDSQLEESLYPSGAYQVLESVVVAGDATLDVDTNLMDNLPATLTIPESLSCADLPARDNDLSDTARASDQSTETNRKPEAMSGHNSASSSPDYLQTKAVIEKSPSDEAGPNSVTEKCLDNRAPDGVANRDNGEAEETNLLPPKADLDSMDLIVEEESDGARPDPQGSDSTSDLLNNPDPSDNTGIQKVAQVFIQNRYKTFSKRRIVYSTMIKYTLFFFNFICWVAGIAATGAGYWMVVDKHKVVRDALDFFLDPAIVLCITGGIIFIVAFFGFVGALRENILLLKIWHISLSVFLVLELIFGILVFLFYFFPGIRRGLGLAPEDWGLKEAIRKYKDDKGMRDWIDMVQREMKCCGVTNSDQGYKDWKENQYYECSDSNPSPDRCNVPPSCCIIQPGDYYNTMCGFNTNDKEVWQVDTDIYTQGCVKGFGKWLQSNAVIIGAVFSGVVVPQFIGIVLARVYIKLTHLKETRSRWKKWKVKSLAKSFSRKKNPEPTEV